MAMAIVLITTEAGKDQMVGSDLKKVKGVEKVWLVSGLYDVVAMIAGQTQEEILAKIYTEIRSAQGVRATHTMFCLEV